MVNQYIKYIEYDGPEFTDLSELGRGGMGVVTLAVQERLGRQVALKRVREDRNNIQALAELLREGRLLGTLEHPNIVPVHALYADPSTSPIRPTLVMKRIEGETWDEVLRHESHPIQWHLRVLLQVCDALRFAHSRQIIHRDVKPANVMLGTFGEVYLLDWGIAVQLDLETSPENNPDASALVGTPAYMAPEMVDPNDKLRVDQTTDVYLVGAVLYQLLTGKPPHQGSTVLKCLMQAYESKVPSFSVHVDSEIAEICVKAMTRHKAGRYQTMDDFKKALEDYLEHVDSIRLSTVALGGLEQLCLKLSHPKDIESDADQLFNESLYGFRQALEIWPNNRSARLGLGELLTTMTKSHLAARDLSAAQRTLSELEREIGDHSKVPELRAALMVLEEDLAQADLELVRLQELDRNMDAKVADRQRSRIAVAVAIVCIGPGIIFGIFEQIGLVEFSYTISNGLVGAVLVESLIGIGVFRKKLIQNAMSLRIALIFLFLMAILPFMNFVGYLRGLSALESLSAMPAVGACGTAALAILVDKRMTPLPVIYTFSYVLFSILPEYSVLGIALTNFSTACFLAWIWSRDSQKT